MIFFNTTKQNGRPRAAVFNFNQINKSSGLGACLSASFCKHYTSDGAPTLPEMLKTEGYQYSIDHIWLINIIP